MSVMQNRFYNSFDVARVDGCHPTAQTPALRCQFDEHAPSVVLAADSSDESRDLALPGPSRSEMRWQVARLPKPQPKHTLWDRQVKILNRMDKAERDFLNAIDQIKKATHIVENYPYFRQSLHEEMENLSKEDDA